MNKYSIIIPVYNVETYIDRCLNSIVKQLYNNLEIILIDDGSSDGSPQKCDDWAKKDNRIKVIHKQNGGVSSARNVGIKIATGDYLHFVDADDWVDLDLYKIIDDMITDKNQMILFNSYFVKKSRKEKSFNFDIDILTENVLIQKYLIKGKLGWTTCWNKFFCTEIVKKHNLYFDENIAVGEDFLFCFEYCQYINSVKFVDLPLYYYNQIREESAMNQMNMNYFKRWIASEKIYSIAKDKTVKDASLLRLYWELTDVAIELSFRQEFKDLYLFVVKKLRYYKSDYKKLKGNIGKRLFLICKFPKVYWMVELWKKNIKK